MDELRGNIAYAFRLLRRSPAFTAVAIISLGLGIGANTAIFSLVDTVLLKSLPVADPQTLVFIDNSGGKSGGSSGPPYPCFELLRDRNTTLSAMAAFDGVRFKLTIDRSPEEIRGQYASGNYFDVLGIRPVRGRLLTPADDTMIGQGGADGPVAVISYDLWKRRFGLDPSVVGRTIQVRSHAVTIIGVTPPGFFGLQSGSPVDLTLPFTLTETNIRSRTLWFFSVVGRLKPGIDVEQARAELHALWDGYMNDIGEPQDKRTYFSGIALVPASRGLAGLRRQLSEPLLIIMAIVVLVLMIGCANLANLLLARASARTHEFSVRLAIGAGRARLVRQLLTEGAVLSLCGAVAGLALARWGVSFIVTLLAAADDGNVLVPHFDWRVWAFTIGAGVLTTVLFSLAPAMRATRVGAPRPAAGGVTTPSPLSGRLGQSIVVVQVTLSIVLLSAAVMFARTLQHLEAVDSGFDGREVIAMAVETTLPRRTTARPTAADTLAYHAMLGGTWRALIDRISEAPGVAAAAVATMTPLSGRDRGAVIAVSGAPVLSEQQRSIHINHVTAGYFDTLRIRIRAGRGFTPADRAGAARVVVLNRTAARDYFGDQSPTGRRVSFPGQPVEDEFEVVGVVDDVRYENARTADERMAYIPIEQAPDPVREAVVVARGESDAPIVGTTIRDVVEKSIPGGFAPRIVTISEAAKVALTRERLLSILASFFGALALLLAAIGLYGVMAYGVVRRTREIGIRLAIGATKRTVIRLIVGETLTVVAIGILLGVFSAAASSRLVRNQLFGVSPGDSLAIAAAVALLVIVAVAAAVLPARRAARVDPVTALRCE